MEIEIPIGPSQLRTEPRGFDALSRLHAALQACTGAEVLIDCSRLLWFDAHLAAPLATVIRHARSLKNRVRLRGLSEDVSLILRKNGLLANPAHDRYHTTIPVTPFGLSDEVAFSGYSRKHLLRKEMPRMSPSLQRKFFEGIDEIFANCSLHSQSPIGVIAAGQFFPRNERLSFAVSDGGRGVDGSLRDAGIPYRSPADAIDWAMSSQNTTRKGDIPGGLGLKLLREFIAKNKGRLIVVSQAGYWSQNGEEVMKSTISTSFPGTVVIMEILTSDKSSYDLKKSVDPLDIF